MTPQRARVDIRRTVRASVADLTAGQRWTISLMLGLAVVVLAFGLPSATRTLLPSSAAAEAAPSPAPARPEASVTALPPLVGGGLSSPDGVTPVGAPPVPSGSDPSASPAALEPLEVVALVDPSVGLGDRNDAAMARRFFAPTAARPRIVSLAEVAASCEAVAGATLAVAGGAVPAEVAACLRTSGIPVLAFDDGRAPGAPDGFLSTRRGVARSLLDTAEARGGAGDGALALVADERFRSSLEPVLPRARAAGLDIDEVVWLPPGEPPVSVALSLAGTGIGGVLFATSVANQSTIGAQLRTLSPGVELVVLDAADSIVTATYPPLFDGAVAVTSLQLPWHPGEAELRAACGATWEQAQTPPLVLDGQEALRALVWCQHAAMVDAISQRTEGDVEPALLGLEVASPVTTRLARLADGGFGPTLLTVATWSARCACWSSAAPFEEAPADG